MTVARPDQVRALAQEIEGLRRKVNALANQPRLIHSSIEDGTIYEYDRDGNLVQVIGKQYDNTHGAIPVGGPAPPMPNPPEVFQILGGFRVRWDGTFAFDAVAPMDFARVEVQVSTDPAFTGLEFAAPAGAIDTQRGGDAVIMVEPGAYYVRLVARATTGKLSLGSGSVGPISPGQFGDTNLGIDFENIRGSQIFYGADEPEAGSIGDLWLQETAGATAEDPPQYETLRWDGFAWIRLQQQGITDALLEAEAAQSAAAAKAQVFAQPEQPPVTGRTVGDIWIDTDRGNMQFVWQSPGPPVGWVVRRLGNSAIEPKSLIAKDVVATGTVSAALLEAVLVLATEIIAGNPTRSHARMRPTGFYTYALDPDGNLVEATRFGTSDSEFLTISGGLASIDSGGHVHGTSLSVAGDGAGGGFEIFGKEWSDWIEETSGGLRGLYRRVLDRTVIGNTEYGVVELAFPYDPGRLYRIVHEGPWLVGGGGGSFQIHIRRTFDGSAPLVSSPLIDAKIFKAHTTGLQTARAETFLGTQGLGEGTCRILFAAKTNASGMTVQLHGNSGTPSWWYAEDLGPHIGTDDGQASAGGASGVAADTPTTSVKTQTASWSAAWSHTYRGNNTQRTDVGSEAIQGYADGFNGNQLALIGFPTSIATTLSGATINWIEVEVYFHHWWFNGGGTAVIGNHGHTSKPSTPGSSVNQDAFRVNYPSKSGRKRFRLPASWLPFWLSGAHRGIVLGRGPTTSGTYYGRAYGAGHSYAPKIFINYTK